MIDSAQQKCTTIKHRHLLRNKDKNQEAWLARHLIFFILKQFEQQGL